MGSIEIVAGLATVAGREEAFTAVTASILPQVDSLYIVDHGRQTFTRLPDGVEYPYPGDVGDAGKFYGLWKAPVESIYLTLDDDLIYPEDYVEQLMAGLARHRFMHVCSFHGRRVVQPFAEGASFYYGMTSTSGLHCLQRVAEDTPVHLAGTGTMGFYAATLKGHIVRGLTVHDFAVPLAADLNLAVFCQRRQIGMICLAHDYPWLQPHPSVKYETTIHARFRHDSRAQEDYIRTIDEWRVYA